MTTTTLTVPDISCDHCKTSIEDAVASLSGVDSVEVEIEPRLVHISFDDGTLSLDRIKVAIEEVGYEVPEPS